MTIKKHLKGLWYKWNQNKIKYVNKSLCGVELLTHQGTIKTHPDQGDAWFVLLAKQHQVVFDIGSNVGYTALLAMIQKPERPYLLVDPNPKALAMASSNLFLNNLGFKTQYHVAFVSDKMNDTVKFYTVGVGAAGSMHPDHAKSAAAINAFKMVKTVTLDFLQEFYNLSPDLVKIDVEGAEVLVMQGATQLAQKTQCHFFIEMHAVESLSMQENAQKMIAWCQENNYRPWYLKTGEILITAETIKNRGKCHLLLIPENKDYPEYLKGVAERASLPASI